MKFYTLEFTISEHEYYLLKSITSVKVSSTMCEKNATMEVESLIQLITDIIEYTGKESVKDGHN